MSIYYDFFIGRETEEGIEVVGPYYKKDGKFELKPLYWASGSFIDGTAIKEDARYIEPEEFLHEEDRKNFCDESLLGNKEVSFAYAIPLSAIRNYASSEPERVFVTIEDLDMIVKNEYSEDAFWDCEMLSPETIAYMPEEERRKYVPVSYVPRSNKKYVYNVIWEAFANEMEYDTDIENYIVVLSIM